MRVVTDPDLRPNTGSGDDGGTDIERDFVGKRDSGTETDFKPLPEVLDSELISL